MVDIFGRKETVDVTSIELNCRPGAENGIESNRLLFRIQEVPGRQETVELSLFERLLPKIVKPYLLSLLAHQLGFVLLVPASLFPPLPDQIHHLHLTSLLIPHIGETSFLSIAQTT